MPDKMYTDSLKVLMASMDQHVIDDRRSFDRIESTQLRLEGKMDAIEGKLDARFLALSEQIQAQDKHLAVADTRTEVERKTRMRWIDFLGVIVGALIVTAIEYAMRR